MADAQRILETKNKELVTAAYQACFGDQDVSAVDKYFGTEYIDHNPLCSDGLDGLKATIAEWATGPKKTMDIRRAAADGDLVWIHVKFPDPDNAGKFLAIVDIFRVKDGKIIEHWDVIQPITDELVKDSKNAHPFF